jgi:hypothetical protein
MFAKTIELKATKKEFLFSYGMKEERFRPVIYLTSDKRVMTVGEAPKEGVVDLAAHIFEDKKIDDSFALLETMMRYGVRKVIGGFFVGTLTIRISIGADIREDLKGFAPAIFHYAATNAGAGKVVIL